MGGWRSGKRWTGLAILITGIVLVWRYWGQMPEVGTRKAVPTGNSLGEVKQGDIVQRVTMTGTMQTARTLIVRAPYKGFVKRVFVKVGDKVKTGAPLVAISQVADQAEGEIFPIRSTLTGTVTQVVAQEGEAADDAYRDDNFLVRVDDLSGFSVECDVPELDVMKLQKGQPAVIRISSLPKEKIDGKVDEIALASSIQERWNRGVVQYRVTVKVTGSVPGLRPGLTTMVDIITDQRKDVLTIGQEFVEEERGEYFVTLQTGERRKVQVGLQDESSFEIREGLTAGDKVRQVDFVAAAKKSRGGA